MSFPRRSDVRVHATLLAACLAVVYAANVSTPGLVDRAGQIKGTDFANFYALGSLARAGQGEVLYDRAALVDYSLALLPELTGWYYLPIYGPQVSLFFAPFSTLPYAWALVVWVLLTVAIYAACCFTFWKTCPALRNETTTVALVALGAPALFNLVAHGQNSAIALACLTAAFLALTREQSFLAGLAIGMLAFKPQLGLVAACVFVANREWRVVMGAVVAAGLQFGVVWLYYGADVITAYGQWMLGVSEITPLLAIKPYQMHSLMSFWQLLIPVKAVATAAYAVCAAVVVVTACLVWRARAPLSLRYSFLLLSTVLVSPHLYVYDLVILAPAFLMCVDWALDHCDDPFSKPIQRALYFSYALPLLGAAAQFTRVQVSVIAMSGWAAVLALITLRQSEAAALPSAFEPHIVHR